MGHNFLFGFKKKLKAIFGSSYLTYFQVMPNPITGSIGSHMVLVPKSKTSKFYSKEKKLYIYIYRFDNV
jgi:hypothetical protein